MREQQVLLQACEQHCPAGSVISLFGSRVDNERRGGDIDLLIETPMALSAAEEVAIRGRFLASVWRALGESRIDLIFTSSERMDSRPVVTVARAHAIRLEAS